MSLQPGVGTTPPGATDETEAARWVRGMFSRVARRYDLLNHLLSFNVDRRWRARTVRRLCPVLEKPGARALDICCGTGDLALALKAASEGSLFGSDFAHPMLVEARRKSDTASADVAWFEADALALPVPDGALDLITAAFGFRNLANYGKGLAEMRRVLKPGGTAAILEFSQPESAVFARLYGFYSNRVLPVVGGVISGDRGAYRYLPESVRKFPSAEELAHMMRRAQFDPVHYERMTGGIVALHIGIAE